MGLGTRESGANPCVWTGENRDVGTRGQLSVERPVLDDTGDGVGKESGESGPDGSIASRTFLDSSDDPGAGTGPALSELINRRNALEADFDDLKRKRSFMPAGDYDFSGPHHEIYLGDPRKTAPEKLKTILRQPVRKV